MVSEGGKTAWLAGWKTLFDCLSGMIVLSLYVYGTIAVVAVAEMIAPIGYQRRNESEIVS